MRGRHVHWHDAARIAGRMIKGLMEVSTLRSSAARQPCDWRKPYLMTNSAAPIGAFHVRNWPSHCRALHNNLNFHNAI